MPTFDVICLAKSIKNGGRCIAGIKTDGSGWLRPVSDTEDGTLREKDYILNGGHEPQIFDIIRIHCSKPFPRCHQPENWVIEPNNSWKLLGTPSLTQIQGLLSPEVLKHSSSPELFGSSGGHIYYNDLKQSVAHSSLALIYPRKLSWQITSYENKKKFKAHFLLNKTFYSLPITDPIWKSKLEQLDNGTYSCQEVIDKLQIDNFDINKFILTISLGEPFTPPGENKQFCYKLVAAVINFLDVKKRLGFN
ncbi:hypothetical protein [Nostoc sp. FACHB-888]|uniref:dual OB domain-containing protein n=1 Tax=Nostoc sp. FACHB-888 TaxID=2692842 RepID=UPI0016899449|nr:hypothetical protein [Nostoc sp. FACHB-888]MBD2249463.1 hypothetical protein [Nostoc sp. FACHB-888]